MNHERYEIEIITPCFCAGADQKQAEVRAPSIRGQLRWWFRALGGNYEQEKRVFGGVHDREGMSPEEKGARSSNVVVRIGNIRRGPEIEIPFKMNRDNSGSYIWHYASVSCDEKRWWANGKKGGAQNLKGFVPVGTKFDLNLSFRTNLEGADRLFFERALECFLRFGGTGMRLTRGMGSVFCDPFSGNLDEMKAVADKLLLPAGFQVEWQSNTFDKWESGIVHAEEILKKLRTVYPGEVPSRLGGSRPNRQTSAVYFRVIKLRSGKYVLLTFTAPLERVLGPAARMAEGLY